mmetsp:Transcript_40900/g.89370  ORF Transcript_40900/g.89370 Transcript_40900/m.89370 type:complete len:207 (-) Transcript_40900:356-976(-)
MNLLWARGEGPTRTRPVGHRVGRLLHPRGQIWQESSAATGNSPHRRRRGQRESTVGALIAAHHRAGPGAAASKRARALRRCGSGRPREMRRGQRKSRSCRPCRRQQLSLAGIGVRCSSGCRSLTDRHPSPPSSTATRLATTLPRGSGEVPRPQTRELQRHSTCRLCMRQGHRRDEIASCSGRSCRIGREGVRAMGRLRNLAMKGVL